MKIATLIAKLRRAKGPDRDLDYEIFDSLGFVVEREGTIRVVIGYTGGDHITGSLDAAIALTERLLPPWWSWLVRPDAKRKAFANVVTDDDADPIFPTYGATPAIALLAAALQCHASLKREKR